ncbi:MAG: serine/threonine protein phosphatase [Ruminococcus sp.]|nr:serine/threonine protein phosphatase [Ruminococcus sp.]
MGLFSHKKKKSETSNHKTVQTAQRENFNSLLNFEGYKKGLTASDRQLYESLRASVPVIDAAVCKIIRLLGTFEVKTEDKRCQSIADSFIKDVSVGAAGNGLDKFIFSYMDSLLTYGEAVGEIVLSRDGSRVAALYNANLDDVEIREGSSVLEPVICVRNGCELIPVKNQSLVFATLLNPVAGTLRGNSLLGGLSYVSSVLLRIFESIKTNWERVGNVRFAVTYNPSDGSGFTEENAKLIAEEWSKAMRSDNVCDFVSIGDISVKTIGADNAMPECEVPIRHLLEQMVAKLGIPPFLLGFSWSSTERMSKQQADILTSELEYYRNLLNPVIKKIVLAQLRLNGYNCGIEVEWGDINLQDAVELSEARLNNANAQQIEIGLSEVTNE